MVSFEGCFSRQVVIAEIVVGASVLSMEILAKNCRGAILRYAFVECIERLCILAST